MTRHLSNATPAENAARLDQHRSFDLNRRYQFPTLCRNETCCKRVGTLSPWIAKLAYIFVYFPPELDVATKSLDFLLGILAYRYLIYLNELTPVHAHHDDHAASQGGYNANSACSAKTAPIRSCVHCGVV